MTMFLFVTASVTLLAGLVGLVAGRMARATGGQEDSRAAEPAREARAAKCRGVGRRPCKKEERAAQQLTAIASPGATPLISGREHTMQTTITAYHDRTIPMPKGHASAGSTVRQDTRAELRPGSGTAARPAAAPIQTRTKAPLMRIMPLVVVIAFLAVVNEANAMCMDGATASCSIDGQAGTKECIGGHWGPCEVDAPPPPPPSAPCPNPCTGSSCLRRLNIAGRTVPYYSNYPLQANACVERAVIVVHGSGRDALAAFNAVMGPADSEGVSPRTLVVAPFFQTSDDGPTTSDLYWSESGWKQGDLSSNGSPRRSSFEVMDSFVLWVATGSRFANLDTLVVAGHSAGGQFVQRYAVGTTIDDSIRPEIFVRFVSANPGSYLYLNHERPSISDLSVFITPSDCPEYNQYRYGMDNRNTYMSRRSAADMIASYRTRHVVYFLGDRDIVRDHTDDNQFDDSCSAMVQGLARYYRGLGYFSFMEEFYQPHAHVLAVAPGIGHSATAMYASPHGRSLLFY